MKGSNRRAVAPAHTQTYSQETNKSTARVVRKPNQSGSEVGPDDLTRGDVVRHPDYGRGTVRGIEPGTRGRTLVVVDHGARVAYHPNGADLVLLDERDESLDRPETGRTFSYETPHDEPVGVLFEPGTVVEHRLHGVGEVVRLAEERHALTVVVDYGDVRASHRSGFGLRVVE